jgi:hypothetical protein
MPTRPRDRPMLVFPTEKLDAQEGNSFGDYLAKVKKEAMTFLAQADEIHIVGYSIQSIDFFEFKQFINAAKSCKLIVVQNLESERMRLERILNNLRAEVKAGWKIEYRAEGF